MTDDIFVPGTIIGTKSRYLQVCYIILFPIDEHRVMTLDWHGKLINTARWGLRDRFAAGRVRA